MLDDVDEHVTHRAACFDSDEPPRERLCAWCRAQVEACERAAQDLQEKLRKMG